MRNLLRLLFLTFTVQYSFSQTGGETLYSFLNLTTSPKQVALGGVTLTSQNDVSQALWNPSILNKEIDGDLSLNFVDYVGGINVGSLTYARSINPKYGIAFLGIQYFDYGDLENTEADGPQVLGTFSPRDLAVSLGYAYKYKDISIGGAIKYVSSKIDTYTSSALLYDLGVTYYDPYSSFVLAFALRNSGKELDKFDLRAGQIKNNAIVSVEYQLEHVPIKFYGALDELNNWDISEPNPSREKRDLEDNVEEEDISRFENAFRHFSGGAELWPDRKFTVRIGYNHRRSEEFQLNEIKTRAGLSYGFGINTDFLKFDYAFAKFQEGAKFHTFGLTLHM